MYVETALATMKASRKCPQRAWSPSFLGRFPRPVEQERVLNNVLICFVHIVGGQNIFQIADVDHALQHVSRQQARRQ